MSFKKGLRAVYIPKMAVLFRAEDAGNVEFLQVPQSYCHFPVLFRLF